MPKSKFNYANLTGYIDLSKVDSYSGIRYVYIDSGRGPGKTFAVYTRMLRRFFNHGEKFMIIRRYKAEASAIIKSEYPLTKDVQDQFGEHVYKVKDQEIYIDGIRAGIVVWLNGLGTTVLKSVGAYNVSTLLFDEFQPEFGVKFLENEVDKFQSLMSTVTRQSNDNWKVFLLSNSFAYHNPYYDNANMHPKLTGGLTVAKERKSMIWHITSSTVPSANTTEISAMSANKASADYMRKGSYFDMNHNEDIWKLHGDENNLGSIVLRDREIGVKRTVNGGIVYTVKYSGKRYSVNPVDGITDVSNAPFWKKIQIARSQGKIYYENTGVRNSVESNFSYLSNIKRS